MGGSGLTLGGQQAFRPVSADQENLAYTETPAARPPSNAATRFQSGESRPQDLRDPEVHLDFSTGSRELYRKYSCAEGFPTRKRVLMTFLPIAGVILIALWLLETVLFLLSYRQSKSS